MQSQPPPLPGDQPELMFPHTGMLVGSANPHPSTTDLDSTQLPSLSSLMSSTAQEQRSSVFSPNAQPVAQITHSSALANTVPSLLQLTNQHTGKGSDTFSFHRTSTGFTDKSASSPSLSESVTHATPSPHTPELTHDYCDPSDSYTSQPSSAHSPLSQLAVQHINSSVKSCINTPRKTPRHTDISESSQGGTSDAHTTCNPQSQLSLLELASQNVTNVTPSIAPDIDQGPTWQSSGTQLATLCQQHLNEPAIKQHSQSKPRPPTSNRPVTTTATTFTFSPFGDSEMTPKQSTGLSLADLARMHDPTVSPSRSPPLSVSSAQSSPTPSLSSLVKSHLAVEAGDTSGDGSPTKDPCQSPSTPSLPTSSSPLSTLLTRRIAADLSEPSSTHSPQLYVGSSLSSLAAQQPGETLLRHTDTPTAVAIQRTLCGGSHPVASLSDDKSLSLSQLAQLHHTTSTVTQQHSVTLLGSAFGDMTLKPEGVCIEKNSFLLSSSTAILPQDKNKVTFHPQHKQNRLFALTMCCSYAQQRKTKHVSKLHHSILKQLTQEFVSKYKFDFSTPSPDDVVKEKQKKGFKRHA